MERYWTESRLQLLVESGIFDICCVLQAVCLSLPSEAEEEEGEDGFCPGVLMTDFSRNNKNAPAGQCDLVNV